MSVWSRSLKKNGCRSLLLAVGLFSLGPVMAGEKATRLLVGFEPAAKSWDRARALKNAAETKPVGSVLARQNAGLSAPGTTLITLREGMNAAEEMARLALNPAVAFVEPNYPIKLFAQPEPIFPDDFEFSRQYALHNPGGGGAKTNADISASKAWALTTGSRQVIVAVIDTGIDYFHEDLRENMWRNEREVPGNGIDDDGNGFVDDLVGYDFVSNDSDPFDDNEHGTHVAGIIAARGNNGVGTVGVCWEASLMAVKAFDHEGNGTVADAIAAIHYAVANGARIINASWGLGEKSRALEEAAQFAADSGVLIVAAAGNGRTDAPAYPASFESVLSVAASDNRDQRAGFSNHGPTVDIAAPGVDIYSTLPENRYGPASGTSMASPQVAGVAALVLSRFPNYSRQELFDILVNSVDPVLFDFPVGSGRLNALLAVRMDQPLPIVRIVLPPTLSGRHAVTGTAIGSYFAGYLLRAGAGTYPTNWIELSASSIPVANGIVGEFDSSLIADGTATVQLLVTNQNGLAATASASVRLLNGLITEPLSGDILRPGKYPVRGTAFGAGKTYELFFGEGMEPKSWTLLATGTATASPNSLLGEWDATNLSSGFYALRLLVDTGAAQKFEFLAPIIYIDRELKEGWPAYLPITMDFPPSDWRNARVADLDGDGRSEVILVDPADRGQPQRVFVHDGQGELLWSRVLGFDIPPDLPAIGDIDGDGKQEIFVDGTNGIVALRYDGSPVTGWPVETSRRNHAKVLADLDGDGRLELVAYAQEYSATQVAESRELAVYRDDGQLIRKWELPWCGFTNALQKIFPAVANIDDDPELEIVVVSGCREIAAYDFRSAAPKWRASTEAPILSSPVIGDVDGRDGPDVVVAAAAENGSEQGGVYIFNGRGERWLGWPVLEEYSFTTPPALGDLDQDGRLEIVLSSIKPAAVHVLQWDGFEADGWPRPLSRVSWHNSVGVADVDNDGRPDVLLTAPGYANLVVVLSDITFAGGISAFDFAGEEIRISGNTSFKARLLESATGRWHRAGPAVICDLDGDGRMDLLSASLLDRAYGSYVRIKNRSSIYAWNLDVPHSAAAAPWPMFGHDAQNSGAYSLPMIPIPPPTNATLAIRDRVITLEDHSARIEPLLNDWNASGSPLILRDFSQPTHGTVTRLSDGELLYAPATDHSGFDEFNYSIADTEGRLSTGRVVLRVKPVNDRPVARELDLEMIKNTTVNLFYDAVDAENDPLTFRIVIPPENGEVWSYPSVGAYYPKKGFHGIETLAYVASDGITESDPATIRITVINSNNPPQAIASEWLTKTNRAARIFPEGKDPDGDPLTFEVVTIPLHGTVVSEQNEFLYTPNKDFSGEDSFTFRAFDGSEFGESARIKIGVIITNAPPRASDGNAFVQPNSTNEVRLSGNDPDGDPIEFVILSPPLHGELRGAPPDLEYIPLADFQGPDRFTFKVTDPFAESEPATYTITVSRENRPPVASDQYVSVGQGGAMPIDLDAFDPDGDPLQTIILKGPAHGRVHGAVTNFTYRPQPFFSGTDQFTYKLWDGRKFGTEGRVTINVTSPQPPQPLSFQSLRWREDGIELIVRPGAHESFSIHGSSDLSEWLHLAGPFPANAEAQTVLDTNAPSRQRFYRAIAE
jgi:subtilisin family serine protease